MGGIEEGGERKTREFFAVGVGDIVDVVEPFVKEPGAVLRKGGRRWCIGSGGDGLKGGEEEVGGDDGYAGEDGKIIWRIWSVKI